MRSPTGPAHEGPATAAPPVDVAPADPGLAASWRDAVLQSALDSIVVMDSEGIVREFNPAAERTFGYRREEAVGAPLADLIVPPELRARHWAGLRRYLATGEGPVLHRRIEIVGIRKDGSRLPVELAIVPFRQGDALLFAGYLRDLTDRIEAQEQIRRRTATAQLLQQVPIEANEAATVDEAARICLEQVCRYTGWPVGHVFFLPQGGDALVSLDIWAKEDPAMDLDGFKDETRRLRFGRGAGLPGRVWAAAKADWILDIEADPGFLRKQEALKIGLRSAFAFPVLVRNEVWAVLEFFAPDRRPPDAELVAVLENVGYQLGRVLERRRAEEQLRDANQRLRRLNEARRQLLNMTAHELGNPLTPISIHLGLLRASVGDGEGSRSLDVLERNVARLRALVQDLLETARLEAGTVHLEIRPVDVAAEARRATEAVAEVALQSGVDLRMSGAREAWAQCDPKRLAQVLDNLLSNALKFTPRGGRVDVLVAAGPAVVVEVQDSGIGIAEEGLARLFEPFQQVHDRKVSKGGTGLGLHIARGLVESMGGTLTARSAGAGKGATFRIELPAALGSA